mgnify:CR=1 FL=1
MRIRITVFFLLALPLLAEVELRRASVAALFRDPAVSVTAAGEDPFRDAPEVTPESPVYFGGLFTARATQAGELLLRSSNGIDFHFEGPGFFGIDRFDQVFAPGDRSGGLVPEETRLIMNLREGDVLVDSREVSSDAKILLEVPFGRVSGNRALWFISIEHDDRSQRYDFTIASAEGTLRLTDRQGEIYTLYAGQRLAGAGAYDNPGIEIGEPTSDTRERFEEFLLRRNSIKLAKLDAARLRRAMVDLPDPEDRSGRKTKRSGKQPLFIKPAPAPKPLTFFRGVIAPENPSEDVDF